MQEEIEKLLAQAIETLKSQEKWLDFAVLEISVDYPKNEAFGDFTTNVAMNLGRMIKKNPLEIAERLSSVIGQQSAKDDNFSKVEAVAPGYINFYLSPKYLQARVAEINDLQEKFGNFKSTERAMVEYSQPNTHKEFHVGHLRNVIIGSALVEILKKSGQKVTAANYIGDTGTHVAKCLWALQKFYSAKDLDAAENKAEFLGKAYSRATQEIADNESYEKELKICRKNSKAGTSNS